MFQSDEDTGVRWLNAQNAGTRRAPSKKRLCGPRGKQAKSEGGGVGLWLQNHKNVTYLPGGLEHNLMSCGNAESYWKLVFKSRCRTEALRMLNPFWILWIQPKQEVWYHYQKLWWGDKWLAYSELQNHINLIKYMVSVTGSWRGPDKRLRHDNLLTICGIFQLLCP